ncbi:MAG: NADH-quinone oxidoreductase subunit C [Prevotellaceae bacterium]|jgi:NADH-quinone oxidoreductase subunit C/D|nr:NADH-quinone oxidoreductase subunit C [Prevotellaceae bacterium]
MDLQEKIASLLPSATIEQAQYLTISVAKNDLRKAAETLRHQLGFDILWSLTGMDWGTALGVVYHLASSAKPGEIVVLKTQAEDRENPMLHTVCDLWATAELNEREVYAMFGIRFINNPDMRKLLLNENWVGFPLRKDYNADPELNPLNLHSDEVSDLRPKLVEQADGTVKEEWDEIFTNKEYIVNIGPQHPATHGVLHFRVSLDGEAIKKVDPHLGYIHRGIERMCESLTYPQMLHLTDRLDYLSAHMNRHAICMCVENALQLEIPERVKYIRTLMDELTRIASHLLAWSCMCMDMGGLTAFIYGMRDREKILSIFDDTCGGRLITNYNIIGGVMADIKPGFQKQVKEFIPYMRKMLKEHNAIYTGNVIAKNRMTGIGHMSRELSINQVVSGPSGRASGFSSDMRKHRPYGAYDKVKFNEIMRTEGDTFARYSARLEEISASLDIIEQLIDNIPEGQSLVKTKAVIRLPEGEYMEWVEAARGAFGVYICSKGEKTPYRVKFRSTGMPLVAVVDEISRDEKIADLIAIGGSLDYVVPDIDR